MPMWRCPHCRTPQPEAARCWVCHASSTACASCRHFRRSIAAQLGFCGLDRARAPLSGTEIRACWEAAPAADAAAGVAVSPAAGRNPSGESATVDRTPVRGRDFVPVIPTKAATAPPPTIGAAGEESAGTPDATADLPLAALGDPEARWSLWGDLEA